jgi:hypothetical protein
MSKHGTLSGKVRIPVVLSMVGAHPWALEVKKAA